MKNIFDISGLEENLKDIESSIIKGSPKSVSVQKTLDTIINRQAYVDRFPLFAFADLPRAKNTDDNGEYIVIPTIPLSAKCIKISRVEDGTILVTDNIKQPIHSLYKVNIKSPQIPQNTHIYFGSEENMQFILTMMTYRGFLFVPSHIEDKWSSINHKDGTLFTNRRTSNHTKMNLTTFLDDLTQYDYHTHNKTSDGGMGVFNKRVFDVKKTSIFLDDLLWNRHSNTLPTNIFIGRQPIKDEQLIIPNFSLSKNMYSESSWMMSGSSTDTKFETDMFGLSLYDTIRYDVSTKHSGNLKTIAEHRHTDRNMYSKNNKDGIHYTVIIVSDAIMDKLSIPNLYETLQTDESLQSSFIDVFIHRKEDTDRDENDGVSKRDRIRFTIEDLFMGLSTAPVYIISETDYNSVLYSELKTYPDEPKMCSRISELMKIENITFDKNINLYFIESDNLLHTDSTKLPLNGGSILFGSQPLLKTNQENIVFPENGSIDFVTKKNGLSDLNDVSVGVNGCIELGSPRNLNLNSKGVNKVRRVNLRTMPENVSISGVHKLDYNVTSTNKRSSKIRLLDVEETYNTDLIQTDDTNVYDSYKISYPDLSDFSDYNQPNRHKTYGKDVGDLYSKLISYDSGIYKYNTLQSHYSNFTSREITPRQLYLCGKPVTLSFDNVKEFTYPKCLVKSSLFDTEPSDMINDGISNSFIGLFNLVTGKQNSNLAVSCPALEKLNPVPAFGLHTLPMRLLTATKDGRGDSFNEKHETYIWSDELNQRIRKDFSCKVTDQFIYKNDDILFPLFNSIIKLNQNADDKTLREIYTEELMSTFPTVELIKQSMSVLDRMSDSMSSLHKNKNKSLFISIIKLYDRILDIIYRESELKKEEESYPNDGRSKEDLWYSSLSVTKKKINDDNQFDMYMFMEDEIKDKLDESLLDDKLKKEYYTRWLNLAVNNIERSNKDGRFDTVIKILREVKNHQFDAVNTELLKNFTGLYVIFRHIIAASPQHINVNDLHKDINIENLYSRILKDLLMFLDKLTLSVLNVEEYLSDEEKRELKKMKATYKDAEEPILVSDILAFSTNKHDISSYDELQRIILGGNKMSSYRDIDAFVSECLIFTNYDIDIVLNNIKAHIRKVITEYVDYCGGFLSSIIHDISNKYLLYPINFDATTVSEAFDTRALAQEVKDFLPEHFVVGKRCVLNSVKSGLDEMKRSIPSKSEHDGYHMEYVRLSIEFSETIAKELQDMVNTYVTYN